MTQRAGWGCGIAAAVLAITASAGAAQVDSGDVARLDDLFAAARARAVHALAPRAFEQAADGLEDLRRRVERGADDLRERLARTEDALSVAEASADRVRSRFDEALAARESAVEQEAARLAADAWEGAEAELSRGGREAQRENFDRAREQDARAAELYRRAGAAARSSRLLGGARDARQSALSAGASELAPATFAEGEEALAAGDGALVAGSDIEIRREGERAEAAFRRAAWLAAISDSLRTRSLSIERFIDAHQNDLARLASAADVSAPDLQDTGDDTAASVERRILELLARNADLGASLSAEEATTAQLSGQVRSLEQALTDSERRYTDTRTALLAREAQADRLRETSALFTAEEGDVFLSGDDLVLRLHGLTFESGSDELDESMTPLLTKVQRVLMDFPDATILIEGHTDSQGNPDRNRALSQSRAIAVREYLLSRLPISSARMEATGHGEDRPIARNDTEEGRARNRRIEITLSVR